MTNEETNKTVEETMMEINEKIEEIDKDAEAHTNRLAKVAKGLFIADKALSILGVSLVVGAVIKESIK